MADVAARVVAWHNRHPLARRVTVDDVGPAGVVALPFATAAAAPGDDNRAPPVAATSGDLRPLFDGSWMYRARARDLPAWVRRHGTARPDGLDGWPRRQIDADLPMSHRADADGLTGRTLRHVISTVVERDGQRTRVLLAADGGRRDAAVFGRRQWSASRLAALAGSAAAMAAAMLVWITGPAPVAPPAAPVAIATSSINAATPTPARSRLDTAADAIARVADAEASQAESPAIAVDPPRSDAPIDRPPAQAAVDAPRIDLRPVLSDADRQAAREAAKLARANRRAAVTTVEAAGDARASVPAMASASASTAARRLALRTGQPAAPAAGPDAAPATAGLVGARDRPAAPALEPPARMFAIATRALASQADADAQRALLRSVVATQTTTYATQLELLRVRGRWRAVWWPHPDREHAEGLMLLARQRGLRVELVEF